jgi:hypothetical protein
MKTLGNAKEVSQGLGMLSIKDLVSKEKELILKTKRTELEQEVKRLKERV